MEWTVEHDVLFCREVIAFDLYHYKSGSKERGQCLDRISESLNSIENPYLKVDQRALRDRIKKLLKSYVDKRNKEEKASGVDVEHTELDDLLLDIFERQNQAEADAVETSDTKNKKLDQEKLAAEETRRVSMERLSETKKRQNDSESDDISPKTKKSRSSGSDTVAYLRDKTDKDFVLRGEELSLRKEELELNKSREEASQRQLQMLIQNSQQQTNTLMLLIGKITEKL